MLTKQNVYQNSAIYLCSLLLSEILNTYAAMYERKDRSKLKATTYFLYFDIGI